MLTGFAAQRARGVPLTAHVWPSRGRRETKSLLDSIASLIASRRAANEAENNLRELDESLARTAQKSGSLRFALGVGLDALARTDGYAELGFTSIDDYGQERCERSPSWIRQSRQLARWLSQVPCLREATTMSEVRLVV